MRISVNGKVLFWMVGLLLSPIFFSAFRIETSSFDLYFYYLVVFFIFVSFFLVEHSINNRLLFIILYLFISSFINVILGNVNLSSVIKQLLNIILMYYYFYCVFKVSNFNIKLLFKWYLTFSVFFSISNLLIFIISILGITTLYDLTWFIPTYQVTFSEVGFFRAHSFFQEPSHYCLALSPAFYVAINSLLKGNILLKKTYSVIIVIGMFLTFSSTGYLAFFISFIVYITVTNSNKRMYIFSIVPVIALYFAYLLNPDFSMRINDTVSGLIQMESSNLGKMNLSSFVIVNHLNVAINNFSTNPLLGGGLGSHGFNYEKYAFVVNDLMRMLNKHDAGSLFIRVLSELGIVGIWAMYYFLFRFRLSKKKFRSNELLIINNSSLVFLLLNQIRGGNYTVLGLPFFVWLYYHSCKKDFSN